MSFQAGEIILRAVVAEIVEQEEWIGLSRFAEAESAAQFDAGALDGGLRLHDAFDGADRHDLGTFRLGGGGRCALRREPADEACELVDIGLEELADAVIRNIALAVDQLGFELNIGFPAHDVHPYAAAEHGAQVVLDDK